MKAGINFRVEDLVRGSREINRMQEEIRIVVSVVKHVLRDVASDADLFRNGYVYSDDEVKRWWVLGCSPPQGVEYVAFWEKWSTGAYQNRRLYHDSEGSLSASNTAIVHSKLPHLLRACYEVYGGRNGVFYNRLQPFLEAAGVGGLDD